jgi:hypothetical protein
MAQIAERHINRPSLHPQFLSLSDLMRVAGMHGLRPRGSTPAAPTACTKKEAHRNERRLDSLQWLPAGRSAYSNAALTDGFS